MKGAARESKRLNQESEEEDNCLENGEKRMAQ